MNNDPEPLHSPGGAFVLEIAMFLIGDGLRLINILCFDLVRGD
jgi:hypothetical protein